MSEDTVGNRLRDFLPDAVENIRQNEGLGLTIVSRIASIKLALKLGRQVPQ